MKIRARFVTVILVVVIMSIFALPVFAVTRSHDNHYYTDYSYSNLSASCCTGYTVQKAIKARATIRLVLEPSSATFFSYGSYLTSTGSGALQSRAYAPNTNYVVVGASHYCYAKCNNCGATTGSYYKDGLANTAYPYH